MKFKIIFLLSVVTQSYVLKSSCTLGTLTEISGSPFATGTNPRFLAFSPVASGNLFAAVPNFGSSNISIFSVNQANGSFSQVASSPFSTGASPFSAAFSPVVSGNLFLAITTQDATPGHVYGYLVNQSTGALTGVPLSPYTVGISPVGVAFSPLINGNLFVAVCNLNSDTISIFSVNTSTGQFTLNSTFSTSFEPELIAFSPVVAGNLFALVSMTPTNEVVVYSVNPTNGAFTQVSSALTSGITTGVAFSSVINGNLFAMAASGSGVYIFTVNQTSGALTSVTGSPFSSPSTAFAAAFSPIVNQNLYAAITSDGPQITSYAVNTSTGVLSSGNNYTPSPSGATYGIAFSPLVLQNVFLATTDNTHNNVHVYSLCVGTPPTCSCH